MVHAGAFLQIAEGQLDGGMVAGTRGPAPGLADDGLHLADMPKVKARRDGVQRRAGTTRKGSSRAAPPERSMSA